MNTQLLPFIFDGCSYLSSSELVKMLKETDNYYYLDDINYLTIHPIEQALCGYLSDTDPIQFFYYVIDTNDRTSENGSSKQPKEIILNCKNFDCLERFLNLLCKHKPPARRICINLPYLNDCIINADQSKTVYENLSFLIKKHEKSLQRVKTLYDFRFNDSSISAHDNSDTRYRLTETEDYNSSSTFNVYENDCLLFRYSPNTYSYTNSILPALRKPAIERLGMNVVSFTDDVDIQSQGNLPDNAIKFCLRKISNIYLSRGYVVKNIAFPTLFENEDICTAIGMTRYRQFVIYKTTY